MHVRVRAADGTEHVVPLDSRLTGIETLRRAVRDKFSVLLDRQRLFYGGKLLENGYSLHDYNIKLNDVIQLMVRAEPQPGEESEDKTKAKKEDKVLYEDAKSNLYEIGDLIDMRDREQGAWFEGTITRIVRDPQYAPPTSPCTNEISENGNSATTKPNRTTRYSRNGEESIPSTPEANGKTSPSSNSTLRSKKTTDSIKSGNDSSSSTPKSNGKVAASSKKKGNASNSKSRGKNAENNQEESSLNGSMSSPKTPNRKKGIADYFSRTPKSSTKPEEPANSTESGSNAENGLKLENGLTVKNGLKVENGLNIANEHSEEVNLDADVGILYRVNLVYDDVKEELSHYVRAGEVRPRARREIAPEQLTAGQTVLLNHNTEDAYEKGYWYDFLVIEVLKQRKSYELIGTLFLGPEAVPQNDTKIRVLDKVYAIEENVPLRKRSPELNELMKTPTEQRSMPLHCTTCRDVEKRPCRDCGCNICAGKGDPEKIVLCDECNSGFHMACLEPPMSELPEEDWYCRRCKRDPNGVVAPGAARQAKKANRAKGKRDWGRGMACVGKTQTCAMPANHFGPIPGVEVGMAWRFRIQLSESGVHRPPVSGIHGRDTDGAYSLVLSGGYEDDVDNGSEFTYTGSGGRDLSGNKRTADQSSDQMLTRENKALARNCAAKPVSEEGADAGEAWRDGRPVRVVRSYKLNKHCPKYAPEQGIRYDGIYKVVKYYPETGMSGFRVWKYLLRRDDPNPAPWEPGARHYPIVFPEGYLEAEAEKKALKEKELSGKAAKAKKRVLRESNHISDEEGTEEDHPPEKKRKTNSTATESAEEVATPKKRGRPRKNPVSVTPKSENPFSASKKTPKSSEKAKRVAKSPKKSQLKSPKTKLEDVLTSEELEAIKADTLNSKLWEDCLDTCKNKGKRHLINHVTELFLCIICQDVATNPVTTKCQHNFCMSCLKLAFRSTEAHGCPHCRRELPERMECNERLQTALRTLMPGYDVGKK